MRKIFEIALVFMTICLTITSITDSALAQQPKVKKLYKSKPKDEEREKKGPGPIKHRKVDADVALLVKHLLERHLAGYPGGKSRVEERFSRNLAKHNVSRAYLEGKAARMNAITGKLLRDSKDASIKQLSTKNAVSPALIAKLMKRSKDDDVNYIPTTPIPSRYGIYLNAIKSLRCADDIGVESGCDNEEPYVIWSCFAPGYSRMGRTDSGSGIQEYDEFSFTQDKHVLGLTDSFELVPVEEPLIFVYQVMEDDPEGPTREEVMAALGTSVSVVTALYEGDWRQVLSNPTTIGGLFDAVITLGEALDAERDDDAYPIYVAFFNKENLWNITNGTTTLPVNVPLFESGGSYLKRMHYIVDIKVGNSTEWKLSYFVMRQ